MLQLHCTAKLLEFITLRGAATISTTVAYIYLQSSRAWVGSKFGVVCTVQVRGVV